MNIHNSLIKPTLKQNKRYKGDSIQSQNWRGAQDKETQSTANIGSYFQSREVHVLVKSSKFQDPCNKITNFIQYKCDDTPQSTSCDA